LAAGVTLGLRRRTTGLSLVALSPGGGGVGCEQIRLRRLAGKELRQPRAESVGPFITAQSGERRHRLVVTALQFASALVDQSCGRHVCNVGGLQRGSQTLLCRNKFALDI
jgi:hypothetical protein